MSFTIELRKETFKFSCTHFTIFGANRAERLHGHNYQVYVQLIVDGLDPELGMAFDFNTIKPMIKEECDDLDEYVLLPIKSPYLKIADKGDGVEVKFEKKLYVFPRSDVKELPIVNITSEELARYFSDRILARLKGLPLREVQVGIEETRGQSVNYSKKLN